MKRTLSMIFVIVCFITVFSSCDSDPYQGKRPVDYQGAVWVCEYKDYLFCCSVKENGRSYYTKNDSIDREISFLWSSFSSDVIVYEHVDDEKIVLLAGECKFNKNWFTIALDYDASPKDLPREIRFERVE